jgi:membrane-bound metal-dependent hydrolase YbcI (DUF457 family)
MCMMYYDHAMVAATVTVGMGAQRRYGWAIVVMAALAGLAPDWDALTQYKSLHDYQIGHRVWGHNLFAATFVGACVGAVGYLIHQSNGGEVSQEQARAARRGYAFWIGLGILIAWSHPLFDLLYCGVDRDADWPVGLLWPVVSRRVAVPWIPWSDWGATGILLAGLLLVALVRRQRQLAACVSLLLLGLYVALRGSLLRA